MLQMACRTFRTFRTLHVKARETYAIFGGALPCLQVCFSPFCSPRLGSLLRTRYILTYYPGTPSPAEAGRVSGAIGQEAQ